MSISSDRKPVVIRDVLSRQGDGLAHLCGKVKELVRLQELLRSELPSPLRDHLFVAGCDERRLLLLADGPAWAARLRFQIPVILALARRKCGLSSVQSVRIKVSPLSPAPAPPERQPRLSDFAAETLKRSAESMTDPALRNCLRRLSARRRSP